MGLWDNRDSTVVKRALAKNTPPPANIARPVIKPLPLPRAKVEGNMVTLWFDRQAFQAPLKHVSGKGSPYCAIYVPVDGGVVLSPVFHPQDGDRVYFVADGCSFVVRPDPGYKGRSTVELANKLNVMKAVRAPRLDQKETK